MTGGNKEMEGKEGGFQGSSGTHLLPVSLLQERRIKVGKHVTLRSYNSLHTSSAICQSRFPICFFFVNHKLKCSNLSACWILLVFLIQPDSCLQWFTIKHCWLNSTFKDILILWYFTRQTSEARVSRTVFTPTRGEFQNVIIFKELPP